MKKLMCLMLASVLVFGSFSGCAPVNSGGSDSSDLSPAKDSSDSVYSGSNEPVSTPAGKSELNVSVTAEPTTLDNQGGVDVSNAQHKGTMFEGLITIVNDKAVPGVAESWDISLDGLEYTFHLRDNARWWDGEPVTAKDFEYAFKRLVDPDGPNGNYAWQGDYIKNGKEVRNRELPLDEYGVKALDDHTFKFELIYRMPYFMDILQASSFYPTRKDYVEKYGNEYASSPDKIMGNGPFRLKEWKHEEQLIYEKNEHYWNAENVQMERINAYIITDEQTSMNMFERGELDVLDRVPKEKIPDYMEQGLGIPMEGATGWWLIYNVTGERGEQSRFLDNVNFRKAFSYAIDRTQFTDVVRGDGSTPLSRINANTLALNDTTWGEKYPSDVYKISSEPEKAKECFDKAMEELGSEPSDLPHFTLLIDDRDYCKLAAEVIQNLFKTTFGVSIEINTVTYKSRVESEHSGDYDMCLSTWAPDYNDAMSNLACFKSGDGYNLYFGGYNNPEYDELIEKANTTDDMEERGELMYQCESMLLRDVPVVPIFKSGTVWAVQKGITDVYRSPFGSIDPNWAFAKYNQQ